MTVWRNTVVTMTSEAQFQPAQPHSPKILIVEDAPDLRDAVEATFSNAGYDTDTADSGDAALREFYTFQPDVVLLDLGLPGMSGNDVCESIRRMSDVPVIVFTALGETPDKLEAFERGADDYIVKGADMSEVVARIGVALRRSANNGNDAGAADYSDAQVHIDYSRRQATVRGREVELTRTEYELLVSLVSAREPLNASQLLRKVWGPEYNSDELVKWHIGRLRKKIELDPEAPALIITRRGFGYIYAGPPA
jgi:two-component system, OmpR family, KDP operon response regulator KdpE